MTSPKQTRSIETLRSQSGNTDQEVAELNKSAKKHAEELEKMDVSKEDVLAIPKLQANIEPEKQTQGLYAVEMIIGKLMVRLKEKKEDVDLKQLSASTLLSKSLSSGIKIRSFERTAIEKYSEITSQSGPTSKHLIEAWQEIATNASEESKKWTEKLEDMWERDKTATIGLLAAGAVGVYLGYKVLKSIFDWGRKDDTPETLGQSSDKGFFESLMPSKKTMGLIGIILLGMFLGRNELKKLLYAKLGIKFGDTDLNDLVKDVKDGKLKEAEERIAALEAKMEEGKEKLAKNTEGARKKLETIKEKGSFTVPRETLIKLYCANTFEYNEGDISEITTAFSDLRAMPVATIAATWNKYKKQENEVGERKQRTMPATGFPIDPSVEPHNIYAAFKIITLTFEGYKKQFSGMDNPAMSLEDFLQNHIFKDPAHKINSELHEDLAKAIAAGKPGMIELNKKIKSVIETDKEGHFLGSLCEKLDIKLDELNTGDPKDKNDFYLIAFKDLYSDGNLKMNLEGIIKRARHEGRSEKAIKVACQFFERVKTRTQEIIIPAIVKRFNLPEEHVEGSKNADLLKTELEKGDMLFKYAVQLNILTKNLDDAQPDKQMGLATELAVLYVATNSMNDKGLRAKYMGELLNYFASQPSNLNINFPSLEALRPYFAGVGKFAYDKVKNEVGQTLDFLSFVTSEMTPKQRDEFLKKAQTADVLEFSWMGAKEAVRGSFTIGKDAFNSILRALNIAKEDWEQVDGIGDYISLILSKGAHILVSTDEKKQGLGIINVGTENFFFKPMGVIREAIRDAAKGDESSGLKTYAIGTAPYVAIGAAWGGVITAWGKSGWAKGAHMLEGALKGLAAPGYLPIKGAWWTYRTGRKLAESGQTVFNVTRDFAKYRTLPRSNINIMMRNAEFVKHYHELMPLEGYWEEVKSTWRKGGVKRLGQRLISPHWNERMMIKYARKFKNRYNKFFGLLGGDKLELHLGASPGELTEIKRTAERMSNIMQRLLKTPDGELAAVIEQLAGQANPYRGEVNTLLTIKERDSLLKKIRTPEGLKKFRSMLNDGAHYIEGRSFWSRFRKGGVTEKLLGNLAKEVNADKIQQTLAKKGVNIDRKTAELIADTKDNNKIREILSGAEDATAGSSSLRESLLFGNLNQTQKEVKAVGNQLKQTQSEIKALEEIGIKRGDRALYESLKAQEEKLMKLKESLKELEKTQTPKGGKRKAKKAGRQKNWQNKNRSNINKAREKVYRAYDELEEIKHSTKTEGRLAKLRNAIGEKTGKAKEKLSDVYKNVAKRFDRYAQAEGNLQKMLANAEADMTTIEKAIARANKMKNAAKAEELLSKAAEAKKEMEKLVAQLNELKKVEEAMKTAKGSAETLKTTQKAVEAAMESSQKAFKAINESSKLIKALKFLKGGGKALFVAAPAVGAWSSGSHLYEAISTDNVERVGMEAAMGGLYLANTAIDTAFAMTLFGKGGTATKALGRAWVPATFVVYSAEKMYEVAEERVRSEAEWFQSYPYDDLIHQWFTTYHGVNLGESWISGFKASGSTFGETNPYAYQKAMDKEVDKGIEEKKKIMHKMFKALIAAHKNPEIYNIMFDENKKQGAKNYEINEAIEKSYTKYHEYYFQHSIATSVKNYGAAKQFIADAQLFDDLMQMREEKKRAGGELKFISEGTVYDLMDERYDITGTSFSPEAKQDFAPYLLIDAYKNHLLTFDKKENPYLEENLEKMDTFYLLRLYVQIHKVTEDPEAEKQLAENPDMMYAMREYATMIRNYLVSKRGVHWKMALNNPKFFEPPMTLEEVLTNLNDMDIKDSPSYQKFEKNIPEESRKPGLYAMYRLAEYFGYTGDPDETTIKEFFCEEKEEFHGIYWDGSEWHMFNPGLSFDLTLDEQDMNKEGFIKEVVERFYQNSNDVLGYRHRSFVVSTTEFIHDAQCFNFAYQVRSMAEILQNGYNEAIRKFHKGRKEIGHIAPQSFESQEPKESEHFEQEYAAEITRIKEGMNWSQLDFEIKDQNTILLKRLDSDAKTTIKKSGDTWNIENYATSLNFAQAVSMSNLLNWVKGESEKHHWVAGAVRPFEVDGGDIDFDKAGVIDTEVLDADRSGNWIKFYEKIGLPKEKMVEILNNWWEKEKLKSTV